MLNLISSKLICFWTVKEMSRSCSCIDSVEDRNNNLVVSLLCSFNDIYPSAVLSENTKHALKDESFEQLVLMFGEMIRHDLFSHDNYLCTLIRRGDADRTSLSRSRKSANKQRDAALKRQFGNEHEVRREHR